MEEKRLIDVCMASGQYGTDAQAIEPSEDTVPLIRISDINEYGTINGKLSKGVILKKRRTYSLKENDMVFARTGETTGKSYLYDSADGNMAFGNFLIRYSLNPELIEPTYMKYYVLSDRYNDWVERNAYRTNTRKSLSAKEYDAMPIPLPSLVEQRKIAYKLDKFFQLITVEEKLRSRYESLADYLFSYLFYEMDKNSTLGECSVLKVGKKVKKEDSGTFQLYTSGGITGTSCESCVDGITVLLPRKGSLNNTFLVSGKALASDIVYCMKSPDPLTTELLYMQLKHIDRMNMSDIVAAPSLSKKVIQNIPVHCPEKYELNLFREKIHPLLMASIISGSKAATLKSIGMDMVNLVWNF